MNRRRARADSRNPGLFGELEAARERGFAPRIVAGLDEAGLGPLLGPLTIGLSAFRVPRADLDLWDELDCAREPRPGEHRLSVADSKVLFTRTSTGARRLERTVLAFDALRAHDRSPARTSGEFLERSHGEAASRRELAREPWHALLPARLAPGTDEDELAEDARRLRLAAERAGIVLEGLWVRAVPPAALNASFARTESKSATHWEACAPFLELLWTDFAAEGVDVVVDRHGGRMRYAPLLRATFAPADVEIVRETPERSEYFVSAARARALRITFAERSESFSFAVALASCAAKYARETSMSAFNAYFAALEPTLIPTAGYVSDARRWLRDAGPLLARAGLSWEAVVRSR